MKSAFLSVIAGMALFGQGSAAEINLKTFKSADLFNLTNVWKVHLTFTAEQWNRMEPKGGEGGPFGGPGRRGGPRGFGPGMFLGPIFMQHGDQNKDGKLSKEEFHSLAEKWFTDWDKENTGKLTPEQIRAGFNSNFGFPPGGRGPGGPPPGMNLQGPEGKRNGLAAAAGLDFEYVHADLEFEGKPFRDVAVRYKGNGTFMQSRGSNKRSFKIDLNKFVKGQKLAGVTTLNLHNNVTDASWMNEVLSHRLFRDAGVPASRTSYARVYVSVPGQYDKTYFGLYSLVENVDTHFEQNHFASKNGAIFKPVTPRLFADLGSDWARYKQTYDPKTEITEDESRRVIEFCRLVSNGSEAEFAARAGDYLDFEEFGRFMAVTTWLSTLDSILSIGQNFTVYLDPKTHKFQFMPWDLDHSFGQFMLVGSQEQRENLSIQKPWRGENRFLERIFSVPGFKKVYLADLEEFSKTIFRPERISKQVDEVAAAIRPAIQEESAEKLRRFEKVVSGQSVEPAGFGGPRPGGFDGVPGVRPIKGFVVARFRSVNDQLAGKSSGETLDDFGPGGPRGRGFPGPGGAGPGGGPGNFLVLALLKNNQGDLTKTEFLNAFDRLFTTWNKDQSGYLTDDQLRAGINEALPFRGGPMGPRP